MVALHLVAEVGQGLLRVRQGAKGCGPVPHLALAPCMQIRPQSQNRPLTALQAGSLMPRQL